MAEKVIAGSVPIATATSILPVGRSPSGTTEPPDERAIMSTAARAWTGELALAAARRRSR